MFTPRYKWLALAVLVAALTVGSIRIGFARRSAGPSASECPGQTQSERAVKERIRIHPGCPRAHFAYAQLLSEQGRNEEARRELREAQRLQPGLSFVPDKTVSALAGKLGMSDEIAHPGQFHF